MNKVCAKFWCLLQSTAFLEYVAGIFQMVCSGGLIAILFQDADNKLIYSISSFLFFIWGAIMVIASNRNKGNQNE